MPNRGVKITPKHAKELKMVLCHKCSDEKHGECMGKAGMFDCDCELCKVQN
ncbi:MAG: hypothetical protein KGH88_01010 [Thaumarchaeota archaeon]|nr:hypothetical protein [Nitrososphaerota archaeon]